MLVSSEGIVIRSTRYSETSAIVKIYTRSHGMLSFIIPGVYARKGTIKPSLIQVFQLLEITFYYRESRNLNKVKEMIPILGMSSMHFDLKKSAIVMVISELVNKAVKEEEKNEELFGFLKQAILILDRHVGMIMNFLVVFFIQFTRYLGFFPVNNYSENKAYFNLNDGIFSSHSGDPNGFLEATESKAFGSILDIALDRFDSVIINKEERKVLIKNMIRYYRVHLSGFEELISYTVLEKIFE